MNRAFLDQVHRAFEQPGEVGLKTEEFFERRQIALGFEFDQKVGVAAGWVEIVAARGDDFDPASSDADFLVEFEPRSDLPPLEEFFGFQADLSRLLERSVDLVEARAVRNPYVLANINRTREVVYAA